MDSSERDPRNNPQRGDMLSDPKTGSTYTVMGRLPLERGAAYRPLVRFTQAAPPYMQTVSLLRWQAMACSFDVKARGIYDDPFEAHRGDVWRDGPREVEVVWANNTAVCVDVRHGDHATRAKVSRKQWRESVRMMTVIKRAKR